MLELASRRDLSVLVPLLNRFTLIEFKGPTDALERGDLAQLVGCAFLWHSQQEASIPQAEISLIGHEAERRVSELMHARRSRC